MNTDEVREERFASATISTTLLKTCAYRMSAETRTANSGRVDRDLAIAILMRQADATYGSEDAMTRKRIDKYCDDGCLNPIDGSRVKRHRTCTRCGRKMLLVGTTGRLIDHLTHQVHSCGAEPAESTEDDPDYEDAPEDEPWIESAPQYEPIEPMRAAAEPVSASADPLADAIFAVLKPRLGALLDTGALERTVREIAQREARAVAPITVELRRPDGTTKNVGRQHEGFPALLKLMSGRINTMLVGPAGSGKTLAAEHAADALDLSFHPKSVGPATTEHSLMGYQDATGEYRAGILFEPFTNGGVLLLDELDSANPAALTTLNTALANDYCSFPHGVFAKHEDFVLIASANTYGRGADRQYVGRAQLDAATLNRFNVIDWGYDEHLERDLADGHAAASEDERTGREIAQWVFYVQKLRKAIVAQGVRMVASTRDVTMGARTIAAGFTLAETAEMRFWTSCDRDTRAKLEAAM